MGVNIIVQKADGTEHPDWDVVRRPFDRRIASRLAELPQHRDHDSVGDEIFRPNDVAAWRAVEFSEPDEAKRFQHLLDLLEADSGYWVHLSY